MSEPEQTIPFPTRLWFAWVAFFRVLFDPGFAQRAWDAREPRALPPPERPAPQIEPPKPVKPAEPEAPSTTSALQLLSLFQREGRLVDFLEQEIAGFGDAEIGGVARVVHEGCRKALREHVTIEPVRTEEEGTALTLQAGFNPAEVKLSGNVAGSAPYKGVLRHRGWRAKKATLPVPVAGHDPNILAPAEVEL
ncbi:MAG: DUF2760 domain-containing protein [Minicystis sp.]